MKAHYNCILIIQATTVLSTSKLNQFLFKVKSTPSTEGHSLLPLIKLLQGSLKERSMVRFEQHSTGAMKGKKLVHTNFKTCEITKSVVENAEFVHTSE